MAHIPTTLKTLIFEWSDFEDIIAKKDLDDVNSMSAWLSKHSGDYPLLNYLFQTFIVLPTSTSDVERRNYIATQFTWKMNVFYTYPKSKFWRFWKYTCYREFFDLKKKKHWCVVFYSFSFL